MPPDGQALDALRRFKEWARHLPALLGILLLIGAIYVVQKQFHHLKLEEVAAALRTIPNRALALSLLWTVLSYGVLTFYDRLGTIFAGRPVSYGRVALASFCAYALSHNLGFAAVSGAAVRYRLYAHWGLTPLQIAKVIAFCSLTFGLGGMVLGGAVLVVEPQAVPFFGDRLPAWLMHAIGLGAWVVMAGYVTLASIIGRVRLGGHEIELPGWRMAILQVLIATADVAVTASITYALLPPAPGLTWLRFVGAYLASYSAGLVATLPGGLGVFDGAMLIGLSPYLDAAHIVGAIIIFRLYYYIIPLFLAGALFTGNELLLRGGPILRWIGGIPAVQAMGRWSEPDFAVAAATGVVAMCGVLLLSLGVLSPGVDLSWIDPDLGDVASQASEFVPSLIGAALIVLSVSLSQRVTLAWAATLALLLFAAAVTVARGEGLWIPVVLVLSAMLLAPLRGAFYRHARLVAGPLEGSNVVPLFALIASVLALGSFERHVRSLPRNSWWELVLSPSVPNALRLSVALAVGLTLFALWRLMRPRRVTSTPWGAEGRRRYAAVGGNPPARADGIVWGEDERAGIPFRRVGGVLLGLGDPVGTETDRVSAIWRLHDLARQEGLDPAVWRAGPALLKVYSDLGLTALPLDRDGLPAASTPLAGRAGEGEGSGYLVCMAERDLARLLPQLGAMVEGESPRIAA
jgi:phosphatidylglycerol lysyltransferase